MRHYQEVEIEFRRDVADSEPYPHARGLVFHMYGADLETCITRARVQFNLGEEWSVVRCESARI